MNSAPARQLANAMAPFAIALLVFGIWLAMGDRPFTGDEPGYLAVAESLVTDRDVELSDEYRAGSITWTLTPSLVPSTAVDHLGDGHLYSVQGLGLPILLIPAVALADTADEALRFAQLTMVLCTALLAQQLWGLLRDLSRGSSSRPLDGRRRAVLVVAWIVVALGPPVLWFSNHLYPEVPAALLVVLGIRAGWRASEDPRWAWLAGAAAAALPWLSVRYVALSIGIAVATILRSRASWARIAIPMAASGAVLAAYYLTAFGTLDLNEVYEDHGFAVDQSPLHTYVVAFGALFSPVEGAIPFSPAYLVALVAVPLALRTWSGADRVLLVSALVSLLAISPLGFRGLAPPGRFVVVVIPLLAMLLFAGAERHRAALVAASAGVLISLVIVASITDGQAQARLLETGPPVPSLLRSTEWLWPRTHGALGIDGVADLPPTTEAQIDPPAVGSANLLVGAWPDVELVAGRYLLEIDVEGADVDDATFAIVLERSAARHQMLARSAELVLEPEDGENGRSRLRMELDVNRSGSHLRPSLWSSSTAVTATQMSLRPVMDQEARTDPIRRSIPVAIAWMIGIGATGAFLARSARAVDSRDPS